MGNSIHMSRPLVILLLRYRKLGVTWVLRNIAKGGGGRIKKKGKYKWKEKIGKIPSRTHYYTNGICEHVCATYKRNYLDSGRLLRTVGKVYTVYIYLYFFWYSGKIYVALLQHGLTGVSKPKNTDRRKNR